MREEVRKELQEWHASRAFRMAEAVLETAVGVMKLISEGHHPGSQRVFLYVVERRCVVSCIEAEMPPQSQSP